MEIQQEEYDLMLSKIESLKQDNEKLTSLLNVFKIKSELLVDDIRTYFALTNSNLKANK